MSIAECLNGQGKRCSQGFVSSQVKLGVSSWSLFPWARMSHVLFHTADSNPSEAAILRAEHETCVHPNNSVFRKPRNPLEGKFGLFEVSWEVLWIRMLVGLFPITSTQYIALAVLPTEIKYFHYTDGWCSSNAVYCLSLIQFIYEGKHYLLHNFVLKWSKIAPLSAMWSWSHVSVEG